jgi:hypothetical protein
LVREDFHQGRPILPEYEEVLGLWIRAGGVGTERETLELPRLRGFPRSRRECGEEPAGGGAPDGTCTARRAGTKARGGRKPPGDVGRAVQ